MLWITGSIPVSAKPGAAPGARFEIDLEGARVEWLAGRFDEAAQRIQKVEASLRCGGSPKSPRRR